MINGIIGVYLREILILKKRFKKVILASSISPLLYLLAFGFGVGKGAHIDGHSYLTFLIPGLITMSSMNQAYGISTELNIARFYFRIFDEFLLAPIPKWQIIAGEVLYGITKGLIPTAIVLVYGIFIGIKFTINPLFFLSLFLHLISFALLGFIIAMIVKNHGDQFSFNTFVITPMIFLSGTFYPVEKMPLIVKYIAYIFPLTYSTKLIRSSLLKGNIDFSNLFILTTIIILLIFIAVKIIYNTETSS